MPQGNQDLFSKPALSSSAASSLAGRHLDEKKKDTGLKWLQELLRKPRGLMNILEIIHARATIGMTFSCECLANIVFNLISLGD